MFVCVSVSARVCVCVVSTLLNVTSCSHVHFHGAGVSNVVSQTCAEMHNTLIN